MVIWVLKKILMAKLNENAIFYQAKSFTFYMSEQPIEILLVKIKLLSKILLHCVIPNVIQHTFVGNVVM